MARKDSEKDSERPHYYSQFWLDVAAGRRIIGAPKLNDEGDLDQEPEPPPLRRPLHNVSSSDGYHETIAHPDVEPDLDLEPDVYTEPDFDDENELGIGEEELPPMDVDETEIPDMDFSPLETEVEAEAEAEEDFYEEEEEEEEEENTGWSGGRGRKKPKPGRQTKLPQKKPTKRDTRRGF